MRQCDAAAIREYGIPGMVLMENAARGTAEKLFEIFPRLRDEQVLIMCGSGNNGGDGFALARHMLRRGCSVTVGSVSPVNRLKGDARTNADILVKIARSDPEKRLRLITSATPKKLTAIEPPGIIIDALLGTGVGGRLKKKYASLVAWMNSLGKPTIAIDIPTGINADTGVAAGDSVRAAYTMTMGLLKTGLLFSDGREQSGKTYTIDIQIPEAVYRHSGIMSYLVEEADVRAAIPKRRHDAHKYKVGKVFVLAGSTGLTGAAALASMSALKAGAGAVVLGIPETLYPFMAQKLTEVMTVPLPESEAGVVGAAAWEKISEHIAWADVVVAGPGLSRKQDVGKIVARLIKDMDKPLVLDADALNVLGEHTSLLKRSKGRVILTPHTGEFSRLTGIPVKDIEADRLSIAHRYSLSYHVVVHLKGGPSITAAPDKRVYINSTGNPGMATAGSGDVLTGVIAGLWAQGMTGTAAAYCGGYIHGYAGDLARDAYGMHSLTAADILNHIPDVLMRLAH